MTTLPDTLPTTASPSSIRATLAQALEAERTAATSTSFALRRGVSFAFLAIIVVLWSASRDEGWRVYLLPMAIHATASALLHAMRTMRFANRVALIAAIFDVGLITTAQLASLPLNHQPAGVAGFSVGLFAMVIVLNALTLRSDVILTTAAAAALGACGLLYAAGVSWSAVFTAALVLGTVAVSAQVLTRRMRGFVARFAAAEVARELEMQRIVEVEEARQQVEGLLTDSRAQNERLARLQRDKESLTQLLVHDLRSPITVIVGYVELVKAWLEQGAAPDSYVKALDTTLATAMRLTAMISDLLQIAKLEEGRLVLARAPLVLGTLLEELADEARGALQQRAVQVEVSLQAIAPFDADVALLRRVLENLLGNASKYTPQGQRIRLSCEELSGQIVLAVANDGPAIEGSARETLFEKYQQGKDRRAGWGLGLYFCRLAVEAHGGSIRIEDRDGFPTAFVVRLPRARPASQPPALGERSIAKAS